MTIDYQVRLMNFPGCRVKETVAENEDGSYTIFIDAALSKIEQQNAFLHAMKHILGDDFAGEDVNVIEMLAHGTEIPKEPCLQTY